MPDAPQPLATGIKLTLVEHLDAQYEYDGEPVTESNLHGWKTFIAMLFF